MSKTDTSYAVFLSYAPADKPKLPSFVKELKLREVLSDGDEVVDATDLLILGSTIRGQVQKAIEDASKVIVIWSKAGAASEWVNYEAGMAEALGKPILVVVPEGHQVGVPVHFAEKQIIKLE